jgi:hypothetical protein
MVKYAGTGAASREAFSWAMFQAWQPDQAGGSYNHGNGTNPLMYPNFVSGVYGAATPFVTQPSNTGCPGWTYNNGQSYIMFSPTTGAYSTVATNHLGISGGDIITIDYALFGDKDEIHIFAMIDGQGASHVSYGAVKEVTQNPNRFLVREAVASGAGNKTVNVGPVNPQTLSNPYRVGDAIQISGKGGTYSSPERVESSTIVSFGTGGPDGSDYTITIASPFASSSGYAIGAILGEEAEPIFMYSCTASSNFGSASEHPFRLHNSAFYNASPDRDYSGFGTVSIDVGYGFAAADGLGGLGQNGFDEVQPNKRSGRMVVAPVVIRNANLGEFRGRMRWYQLTNARAGMWQFLRDGLDNWYFVVPYALLEKTEKIVYGPMPKALAKPY